MPHSPIFIGTASWTVPQQYASHFHSGGSHLERYSSRFNAVEINSSFYRPHRNVTYQRWAQTVPARFQFSVKIPKLITHESRLVGCEQALDRFLGEVAGLGDKLGVLLVQLPPRLVFDSAVANSFFDALTARMCASHALNLNTGAAIACEPRHETWFSNEAQAMLIKHQVARVAADPAVVPQASESGGWDGLVYYRLHGSPRIYYSNYDEKSLATLQLQLQKHAAHGIPTWCIFDNTAAQAATGNALTLTAGLNE